MKKIALGKRARKHKGLETLVDAEDFEELSKHNWYASYSPKIGKYYVQRHATLADGEKKSVRMHRYLTGASSSDKVIHLNDDTLDNRKENLRVTRR